MSSEIRSVLQNYIRQGEILLSEYEHSVNQLRNINVEVTREGLSELAGFVVSEFIPGTRRKVRKYSRKMLNAQSRTQLRQLERTFLARFSSWFDSIKTFLSSVSIKRANTKPPGNSERLIRRFNRIYRYVKPDTKIRNTISILGSIIDLPLIYNRDIPRVLERPVRKGPMKSLKQLVA